MSMSNWDKVDRLFEQQYSNFSSIGFAMGAYHFFNFRINGAEQSVHLRNQMLH